MYISWRGGWIAGCWNAVKRTAAQHGSKQQNKPPCTARVVRAGCGVGFVVVMPVGFVGPQVAAGAAGNVWKASCVHRGAALRGWSNACWPCACVRGCLRFVPHRFYHRCVCSYHGHPVAAKQLKGMADLAALDDALVELVNEVSLFTYMPLPVAPKQQHTGRVRVLGSHAPTLTRGRPHAHAHPQKVHASRSALAHIHHTTHARTHTLRRWLSSASWTTPTW